MTESSRQYVAVRMKTAASDEPVGPKFERIKTAHPNRCDHTETICKTVKCVESWSTDWRLFLRRTQAGRNIIETLRLTNEQVESLAADDQIRPTRLA